MKKNKSVRIYFPIPALAMFVFFLIGEMHVFTQKNIFDFPKIIQLGGLVERSEASEAIIDKNDIDAILNAKVKYIEFSDSKEFDREKNIVYKVTNMAESEKYSEGSMKKSFIRIALEDLNDDGIKEIFAYIEQFEWCGKGGGYCTFLILQKNIEGNWRELFKILTYRDIGILNTKNYGYSDIVFRNVIFRVSNKEKTKDRKEITIWRWDGKHYGPYIKSKTIYDIKANEEKSMLWKWDEKSTSWNLVEEHK